MIDWGRRKGIAESILETAGLTPMVRFRRVTRGVRPVICAKIEYCGPSNSVKDRILPWIVEQAERRGELRPGMTIIEGTTGNTGIATSMVAAVKGYRCIIVMPEGMSVERRKIDLAYGAELVLTPGAESDVDLVLDKVKEIMDSAPGSYWKVGQFENPDNPRAHYLTTGPEIWEQTDGAVDAIVLSQGTGGTITGVARYLRQRKPQVKVFAVEPSECPLLARRQWGMHKIEGIGDGFIPPVLDVSLLDGVVLTTSDESITMAKRMVPLYVPGLLATKQRADLAVRGRRPGEQFYIAGPNDNVDHVMKQLSKKVGEGNFHYLLPV